MNELNKTLCEHWQRHISVEILAELCGVAPISGRLHPKDTESPPAGLLEPTGCHGPVPVQGLSLLLPGDPLRQQPHGGSLATSREEQYLVSQSPGQGEVFLAQVDSLSPVEEDHRWVMEVCYEHYGIYGGCK